MSATNDNLAHHFADLDQQHEAAALGMWIFLATELLFFGGLFTGYAVYRSAYPDGFAEASNRLNLVYGGGNTIVLLTSSLTMVLAVHAARLRRRGLLVSMLALTALLGTTFLVVKTFEYHGDFEERLVPGLAFDDGNWLKPAAAKMFLILYYVMTGVHALHLLIGIGLMVVLAALAWRGRYLSGYYAPIEIGGLYWHFVDVIWIFLLPLLYMIGVR